MLYFKESTIKHELIAPVSYILKPDDILYIKLFSSNDQVTKLIGNHEFGGTYSEISLYVNSVIIASDSTVNVPLTGIIKAAGYTLNEFEQKLQKAINELVIETNVYVRLLSYRVAVFGEVLRPGTLLFYQPNATILDVIARAGDLTPNAKRSEVTIIRKTENQLQQYTLDLSDINILNSPGFYIYPDDVVYVKPKWAKVFRENLSVYAFMLSTITTFVLFFNFIDKL